MEKLYLIHGFMGTGQAHFSHQIISQGSGASGISPEAGSKQGKILPTLPGGK